jgi:hypothetical protein
MAELESISPGKSLSTPHTIADEVARHPSSGVLPSRSGPGTFKLSPSPDQGRRLLEDESTFVDFANSSVFFTIEHEIY